MFAKFKRTRGSGKLKFLVVATIIGVAIWVAVKLSTPYFQNKKLEGEMQYWADIVMARGDQDYSELTAEVQNIIDKYQLPIQPHELFIYYDEREKTLRVWVQTTDYNTNVTIDGYKVDVVFPGYIYTYHFDPRGEAKPPSF